MHLDLLLESDSDAGRILLAPREASFDREVEVSIKGVDGRVTLLLDAENRLVGLDVADASAMLPEAFVTDREFDVQVDAEVDEVYVTFGRLGGFVDVTHPCTFPGQRGMINLDFDPQHRLVGVEVVDATSVLHSVGD